MGQEVRRIQRLVRGAGEPESQRGPQTWETNQLRRALRNRRLLPTARDRLRVPNNTVKLKSRGE